MAEQLKNLLAFNLAPGAQATIAHGLKIPPTDVPVIPDVITLPSPQLSVTATDTNIVLTNNGPATLQGSVLVEYWHTFERAFGDVATTFLTPRPFIIVGAEGGNQPPQPAFVTPDENIIIYARATGSDVTGDGRTPATAYRTVQRAVRDIPSLIPGGVFYYVDCTNLLDGGPEVLPVDYELPAWKCPHSRQLDFDNTMFPLKAGVNIVATPRLVASLGDNAIITAADLVPTAIGGGIPNGGVTNTAPIAVTTNTPHGLRVTDDPGQQVTISGVTGVPSANGTWFVVVTSATSFELVDSDGTGDPGPSVGGTVEVLFLQTGAGGQVEVKTTKNFGADDSQVGRLLIGSGDPFDQAVIYGNTSDTLFITRSFAPGTFSALTDLQIMEQSAELVTTTSVFGRRGGFNVMNIDSIALNGLRIAPSDPEQRGLWQFGGNVIIQGCSLENPTLQSPVHDLYVGYSDVVNAITQAWLYHDRSLHRGEGTEFEIFTTERLDAHESVYMDMFGIFASSDLQMYDSKLLRMELGLVLFEGEVGVGGVTFDDIANEAVIILGQARFDFGSCSSNKLAGELVLRVDQGGVAIVAEDESTFSPDHAMQVGTLPLRSFADFYAGVAGPVGTYSDFTAVDPVTGATGRGGSILIH